MKKLLLNGLFPAVFFFFLFPILGPKAQSGMARGQARPKLIVILVIDQLRFDYLVRFHPQFVERGFNLLLSGANFINCHYEYTTTLTGPGHAALLTGAYPNQHGIVGNEWYDRSLRRTVNCVEDPTTRRVGSEGPGASPRFLIGSTLGDELRLASNFESRVVSISLKDRAAVLPGGHTANAAYWYSSSAARFVTSTYYMAALPGWVREFNDQVPAKAYCGKPWQALPETPGAGGKVFSQFAREKNEPCPSPRFLAWVESTPFMNEIELDLARSAVEHERLGQGTATDLLLISLSVNDYIGHRYGPYSPEVADTMLRTDRYLAVFFNELDRMVGLENVWIALSSDHGVAPNYQTIEEHQLRAGDAQPGAVRPAVEQALSQAFGQDQWIESVVGHSDIYLNLTTLKKRHIEAVRAETVAAAAAASVPGVAAAFTRTQFLTGALPPTPPALKALNSFHSKRSGDIIVVLEPYSLPTQGDSGATHGSAWHYDAHVPLILWGSAFKAGDYPVPCQVIDLAPTVAAALGLTQPATAQGHPLAEALK